MSSFTKPLILEFLDLELKDRPLKLHHGFEFITGAGRVISIPKGYRTDFASIPRFFHRVIPPVGKHGKAAVVHDWLCDESPHTCSHIEAAEIFREALTVLKVSPLKITLMVKAVKRFGPKFKKEV